MEYPIDFGSRDVEDLKLRLFPPLTLNGSVEVEKGAGEMPSTMLGLRLQPVKRVLLESEGWMNTFGVPGDFGRDGVPAGTYFPEVSNLPEGWGVKQIVYQGSTLPYGAAITVDGRSMDSNLNLMVSTKLGAASGSIRDSSGNPIPGVKVVLLPEPIPELFDPFALHIKTVDAQGGFSFDKLPPGKYIAIPLTGDETKADRDLVMLRRKSALLDAIDVQAGQIAVVAVKPLVLFPFAPRG